MLAYGTLMTTGALTYLFGQLAPASRRLLGWLFALLLAGFAGLRSTSTDFEEYEVLWNLMLELDVEFPARLFLGKDILFGAIMDALQRMGAGLQALMLAAAIISVSLKQIAFSRVLDGNTAPAWLAILCTTFFLHEFTQIRIAIAISFCFLALLELLEGRRLSWLLITLIAAGFHASALIFIPLSAMFPLRGLRDTTLWLASVAATTALATALFQGFQDTDGRIAMHAGELGTNWTAVMIGIVKLSGLILIAKTLGPAGRTERKHQLVSSCLLLAACGLIMLVAFRNVSAALAFRIYEFCDAFAVLVLAVSLASGTNLSRILTVAYCLLGLILQVRVGLLSMPYEFAPVTRFVL
ncbi:hypothetical protein D621_13690 [beta proteobacterium AAP51]|nr:hypothetical protein D621_13690 [beta proteobacterium AAP51]